MTTEEMKQRTEIYFKNQLAEARLEIEQLKEQHETDLSNINTLSKELIETQKKVCVLEAENQKLKEMIRAIPCTCDEAYKSRGLTAPDCPRCNYVDENGEFQVVADAGKYFGIDKE